MFGLGTIINVAAIVAGGILGLLFGKRLSDRLRDTLQSAIGVSVLFVGISGALSKMFTAQDGVISSDGALMMILSMALGAVVGELLNLDGLFEKFGDYLRRVSHSNGDNQFLDSFLTATYTVLIGAMAIVGSIEDGIDGNITTLCAKSILDFVIVMILAAAKGKGAIFSALPVLVWQGAITVVAYFVGPVLSDAALSNLSLVGSVLIFCVGYNLIWEKKIKVSNLLPALLFAVLWAYLPL